MAPAVRQSIWRQREECVWPLAGAGNVVRKIEYRRKKAGDLSGDESINHLISSHGEHVRLVPFPDDDFCLFVSGSDSHHGLLRLAMAVDDRLSAFLEQIRPLPGSVSRAVIVVLLDFRCRENRQEIFIIRDETLEAVRQEF